MQHPPLDVEFAQLRDETPRVGFRRIVERTLRSGPVSDSTQWTRHAPNTQTSDDSRPATELDGHRFL